MNKTSVFFAAATASAAVISIAAPVSAEPFSPADAAFYLKTADEEFPHPFTDVSERYGEAAAFFYEIGLISGMTPTKFGTYQPLTRGDAAVILAATLGLDTEEAPDAGFTDLNKRVRGSVNALAETGIVSGVTTTQFRPAEPLSRGAMAKFLVTAFELENHKEETPFTDAEGVFAPYIEALYGTGITAGKTETSYGTHENITRGDFINLLYSTLMFVIDDYYYPVVKEAAAATPTSIRLTLSEPLPEEYAPRDAGEFFYYSAELEDGTTVSFYPTAYVLSKDRLTLTVEHKNYDLSGKAGMLMIDDMEKAIAVPFDFTEDKVAFSGSEALSFGTIVLPHGFPAATAFSPN